MLILLRYSPQMARFRISLRLVALGYEGGLPYRLIWGEEAVG